MIPETQFIIGDALEQLRLLPDESVHCCVTSPPYWGLRDYGVKGQIGLERTPEEYVAKIVEVFREVRRVLRSDGTCWINLGDSYNAYNHNRGPANGANKNHHEVMPAAPFGLTCHDLKPKDLCGIPWRVAFALQADGWWLRQDIIWAKPNPMPESVTDRCTKAHEYMFLLAKSERYYYDAEAIKEAGNPDNWRSSPTSRRANHDGKLSTNRGDITCENRNKRSVWTVPTAPYSEAHFATFPPNLIKPCIMAGCPVGGIVLDPFGGSGTTGQVALELGRNAILIDLNPVYGEMQKERVLNETPGLALA